MAIAPELRRESRTLSSENRQERADELSEGVVDESLARAWELARSSELEQRSAEIVHSAHPVAAAIRTAQASVTTPTRSAARGRGDSRTSSSTPFSRNSA